MGIFSAKNRKKAGSLRPPPIYRSEPATPPPSAYGRDYDTGCSHAGLGYGQQDDYYDERDHERGPPPRYRYDSAPRAGYGSRGGRGGYDRYGDRGYGSSYQERISQFHIPKAAKLAEAKKLLAARDALNAELAHNEAVLKAKIICLQNDHKELTVKIDVALHAAHEEARHSEISERVHGGEDRARLRFRLRRKVQPLFSGIQCCFPFFKLSKEK